MKILHVDTTMVNTGHYTFVQTQRMYRKSEPYYKPWAFGDNDVLMKVHRLKHVACVVAFDSGGGCVCVFVCGQEPQVTQW